MGCSIDITPLFETAKSSFEPGTLPDDIILPEGFTVWKYPESFSDNRMVLTYESSFFGGTLKKVWRKEGILPLDDPCFSALMKNQLDKKPKRDKWIRRSSKGGRQVTPEPVHDLRLEGSSLDEKTLVWPGEAYLWSDEPSGVTWLGLHGTDSICVVTKAGEQDVTRVHPYFIKDDKVENALCNFRETLISQIDDLATPYSTFINMFGQSIPQPFGVVSLALGSIDAQEESGRMEYLPKVPGFDKKKTIKYLREQRRKDKTRSNDETAKASGTNYGTAAATSYLQRKMQTMHVEDFTVVETIKTAIAAFQYLFKKEFEAHDIGVSVMDMDPSDDETDEEECDVKHLKMIEIQKYLVAIKTESM